MENKSIKEILSSQYAACFGMLRHAVKKVSECDWNSTEHMNPIWQITYHMLWSTKLYLGANLESYAPFESALKGAESLGGRQDWENADAGVSFEGFHTRDELLTYLDVIETDLESSIEALPLESDSGFDWYPYSRLELHINNIRHIQHHTAQIIERLKAKELAGFPWWADKNPPQEW